MKGCRLVGIATVILLALTVSVPAHGQDGSALYKSKCAMCHGADGKGDTPVGKKMGVHDFASPEVKAMSDGDLTQIITKGKNKMPAYAGKLKESEIKGLVAYIRHLAK